MYSIEICVCTRGPTEMRLCNGLYGFVVGVFTLRCLVILVERVFKWPTLLAHGCCNGAGNQ